MDGFAEWTFEGGLNRYSRRRREPDPLPIRHVWLYMKRVDFSVNMSGTAIIDTITVSGKNLGRFFV
jgi:hypothetical protein